MPLLGYYQPPGEGGTPTGQSFDWNGVSYPTYSPTTPTWLRNAVDLNLNNAILRNSPNFPKWDYASIVGNEYQGNLNDVSGLYWAGDRIGFPTFEQNLFSQNLNVPSQYRGDRWYGLYDPTTGQVEYQYREPSMPLGQELALAASIVGGGALGISGFAGLHGLPGIDSLLSGFSNFGDSFGGGTSGGAGAAIDPWLGGAETWTPEAIAGYLAQPGASTTGLLSQLGGGSSNPMQALQQALQGQVDAGVLTPAQMQSALQSAATTGSTGSSWLDSLGLNSSGGSLLGGGWGSILSGGLQALGGLLTGNQAQDAAKSTADAYIQAAKIAADAAKFKPVGVTTRFGSSNFGYDANGNLTNAGYQLSPDIRAQQTSLMGASGDALQQYLGAQTATAPMGQTAQSLFGLGQGYLGTTPQEQAARYMSEQQALLAPTRERDFAALENRLANQGRLGLATGGTSTGLGAANPELESFYNAQRMQDLKLASEATQGGMDYARFGAGLVGTGGDMLRSMYGTQVAAYDPYRTAIGGASMLEGLGQNAMDLGINIGAKGTAANAQSGMLLSQGMTNAANAMQPANSFSPWGNLLSGAGTMLQNYNQQQPQQQQQAGQFMYNPYTGQPVNWN